MQSDVLAPGHVEDDIEESKAKENTVAHAFFSGF